MDKISNFSAYEARNLIGRKELTSIELVKSCIEQYEKHNPSVNAIVAKQKQLESEMRDITNFIEFSEITILSLFF